MDEAENIAQTVYGAVCLDKTQKVLGIDGTDTDNMQKYFDASKSNSIYGNSTTVQPQALNVKFIIKY